MITLRASRSAAVPVAFMPLLIAKLYSPDCRSCQAGIQPSVFRPKSSDRMDAFASCLPVRPTAATVDYRIGLVT
jgi:hypothetical protein